MSTICNKTHFSVKFVNWFIICNSNILIYTLKDKKEKKIMVCGYEYSH